MLSKKDIIKKEIDSMISAYPIITWFQLTQKTTKKWNEIYVNIEKNLEVHNPKPGDYKYFQAKSKLLELTLRSNTQANKDQSLCQGRLLVYGCKAPELLDEFIKTLEKAEGGFVVGGVYGHKLRTHVELEKLQKLNKKTYASSIPVLNLLGARLLSLKSMCDFSYLNSPYYRLHYLLEHIKQNGIDKCTTV